MWKWLMFPRWLEEMDTISGWWSGIHCLLFRPMVSVFCRLDVAALLRSHTALECLFVYCIVSGVCKGE